MPARHGGNPYDLTEVNGTVFFAANDRQGAWNCGKAMVRPRAPCSFAISAGPGRLQSVPSDELQWDAVF